MRLEGTLDAFSLPDIFQLLSFTRKTGTLHLRREACHGAVHVRDGAVTGARADVRRQALGRRLVGAGLVDDQTLAAAVEQLVDRPGAGLGKMLAERAELDPDAVRALAAEQATDAVFDLMRWPDGEFAFIVDEPDPDDLGAALPVEQVVEESTRRLAAWASLTAAVPAPGAVVSFAPAPATAPVLTVGEWQLLSLVDGRRTVSDLGALSGCGDFAMVGALAALVERGLLHVRSPEQADDGAGALVRRQQLLAALEGLSVEEPAAAPLSPVQPAPAQPGPVEAGPVPLAPVPLPPVPVAGPAEPGPAEAPVLEGVPAVQDPAPGVIPVQVAPGLALAPEAPDAPGLALAPEGSDAPGPVALASVDPGTPAPLRPSGRGPVVPERPEPFSAARRPEHAESGSVGAVHGTAALQPEGWTPTPVERDPSIDKTLLLRLIAGVRGL